MTKIMDQYTWDQIKEVIEFYFDAQGVKMDTKAENYQDQMKWVEQGVYLEYRRPCDYTVGFIYKNGIGTWTAIMGSRADVPKSINRFQLKSDAMAHVEYKFKNKGEDMNKHRVKNMSYDGDTGLFELTAEVEYIQLELTEHQLETLMRWYNEFHSIAVEPECHEAIILDTNGLIEIHNRLVKEILADKGPISILEDVLAIRKQLDNENYWRERISRLD